MENILLQNDLTEVRENFKIEDLNSANWVFRQLRAIANKTNEIKALAEEERNRINSWEEVELKRYEADKQYFEYLLSEYYKKEKAVDKKFRLSTPYGKVTSKKTDKWVYEDEKSLLKYLKESEPNCIRVKEEINKTEVKKIFKDGVNAETGEILPFVRIEEGETISVKVE